MKIRLRDDWYQLAVDPAMNMDVAGIYQWSVVGGGVYVGKAKVLRRRLNAYPRNVRAMIEGRPWHGNPEREYRAIHTALREAYDAGTLVTVTVLETCDPTIRAAREQHWIRIRRDEAKRGGLPVLNSN